MVRRTGLGQGADVETSEATSTPVTIRPGHDGDTTAIRSLALDSAMFAADEMTAFDELLGGYLDGSLAEHRWIVAEDAAGRVTGAAYYAPEPFADRVWNLYFLAVHQHQRDAGIGGSLVRQVEHALRHAGEHTARVLIVETSSTDRYAAARHLYEREGFDREARVRQFYGPDDHKIVFWKSLHPNSA